MASLPRIGGKWNTLLHGLGLSSLGSALFLQATVFSGILQNGYFRGVEQNPMILSTEIALTGFAIAYFGYMFLRFVFSTKWMEDNTQHIKPLFLIFVYRSFSRFVFEDYFRSDFRYV
jgi:hypothetical protein